MSSIHVFYSYLRVLYRDSNKAYLFYPLLALYCGLVVQRVFLINTNCRVGAGLKTCGRRKIARIMANVTRMCGLRTFRFTRVLACYRRVYGRLYQVVLIYRAVPCQCAYVLHGLLGGVLARTAMLSSLVRSSRGSYDVYSTLLLSSLKSYKVRVNEARSRVVDYRFRKATYSYTYFFGSRNGVLASMVLVGLSYFFLYLRVYYGISRMDSLFQYGIFRYRRVSSFGVRGVSSSQLRVCFYSTNLSIVVSFESITDPTVPYVSSKVVVFITLPSTAFMETSELFEMEASSSTPTSLVVQDPSTITYYALEATYTYPSTSLVVHSF